MPRSFVELSPQNFSFNSPLGWCPACEGLGVERGTNQESLIPNPNLTLREGAIGVWPQPNRNPAFLRMLVAIGEQLDISIDTPWYQLDPLKQRVVLYGSEQWIECEWPRLCCTVENTEWLHGHRLSLSALHEELFGEPFSGAHRARTDVAALTRCYLELVKRGDL